VGQPTQRAANYTARPNIEPAKKFPHANGQSAPRPSGDRHGGSDAGHHTPSTASESFLARGRGRARWCLRRALSRTRLKILRLTRDRWLSINPSICRRPLPSRYRAIYSSIYPSINKRPPPASPLPDSLVFVTLSRALCLYLSICLQAPAFFPP